MNKQLSNQFKTLTTLDLENNFILVNHAPSPFKIIDKDDKFILDADLVGSRMGYEVQICWQLPDKKKIWQPDNEIKGDDIEFWWDTLPVAEIMEEERKKYIALFAPDSFNFLIETEIGVWPDLSLLITCKNTIIENDLEEYLDLFAKAQEKWNAEERKNGIIHSIGKISQVNENSFQLNIDFGSACKKGLEFILNSIKGKNTISKVKIFS
jgi:hypothetical protein